MASASVKAAAQAAEFAAADMVSMVTRYAIIVFAVLAALTQLEIAPELVEILFMGIVFAVSLAAGLAFGLGGRDAAARYLDKMTREKTHHNHSPHNH